MFHLILSVVTISIIQALASQEPILPVELLVKVGIQEALNKEMAAYSYYGNSVTDPVAFWEILAYDRCKTTRPWIFPFFKYAVGAHELSQEEIKSLESFLPVLNGHPFLQFDLGKYVKAVRKFTICMVNEEMHARPDHEFMIGALLCDDLPFRDLPVERKKTLKALARLYDPEKVKKLEDELAHGENIHSRYKGLQFLFHRNAHLKPSFESVVEKVSGCRSISDIIGTQFSNSEKAILKSIVLQRFNEGIQTGQFDLIKKATLLIKKLDPHHKRWLARSGFSDLVETMSEDLFERLLTGPSFQAMHILDVYDNCYHTAFTKIPTRFLRALQRYSTDVIGNNPLTFIQSMMSKVIANTGDINPCIQIVNTFLADLKLNSNVFLSTKAFKRRLIQQLDNDLLSEDCQTHIQKIRGIFWSISSPLQMRLPIEVIRGIDLYAILAISANIETVFTVHVGQTLILPNDNIRILPDSEIHISYKDKVDGDTILVTQQLSLNIF